MKKLVCCFALLIVLTGCWLPPGDPPAGNLVSNRIEVKSRAEIAEHLATRLSLFMVEKHSGADWMLSADPEAEKIALQAVNACEGFGCRRAKEAPLKLCGKTVKNGWVFTFFEKDRAIWSEVYHMENCK